jgi:fructokinase
VSFRVVPDAESAGRLVAPVFPGTRVVGIEPLTGGLRNSNFKIHLNSREKPLVLRFYEKDPSVCRKEVALLGLVRPTVPVPEVLHAEPEGIDGSGPYVLIEYVEGVAFRELKKSGKLDALREAARSVGEALAAIGRYGFTGPGKLGARLEVEGPFVEGPDHVLRFLDSCLASPWFESRTGAELAGRVRKYARSWREQLACLDHERSLVHSDFNAPNLLVRRAGGKWRLAAVLDWEFGFSGSPLFDVGNFLRYERVLAPVLEPSFSDGFAQNGGRLPADWRRLARVIDLTSLCEMLAREQLPEAVVSEILELVKATLEDRDPA